MLCVSAQSARSVSNRKRSDTSADDADKEFPRVMFLMHQWFMTSKDLAGLFMNLYPFWCHVNKEVLKRYFGSRYSIEFNKNRLMTGSEKT